MSQTNTGDPVERDFVQCWERTEELFRDWLLDRAPWKGKVLQFMAQLRRAGYDRKLRAGQILDMFVVSRSRRHGLRPDQPRVVFFFHDNVMDVFFRNDAMGQGKPEVCSTGISVSAPVQALLDRLVSREID